MSAIVASSVRIKRNEPATLGIGSSSVAIVVSTATHKQEHLLFISSLPPIRLSRIVAAEGSPIAIGFSALADGVTTRIVEPFITSKSMFGPRHTASTALAEPNPRSTMCD